MDGSDYQLTADNGLERREGEEEAWLGYQRYYIQALLRCYLLLSDAVSAPALLCPVIKDKHAKASSLWVIDTASSVDKSRHLIDNRLCSDYKTLSLQ